ncbi:MAG: hypothetical protein H0U71_07050 [Gammaproteobacteria bacterium]|nr:hypothetical protein [Gammaproteobacteria bacterium]
MLKKFVLGCLALAALGSISSAYAKDEAAMMPPKPVENAVLESMVGTWQGQSNMMGTKMNDTIKIYWALNHQFLVTELKAVAVDNANNTYEGMGMYGIDKEGKVKIWWFDSWGAPTVTTGKGVTQNNELIINDSNSRFNEVRSFKVNGNEMTMHAKGSMNVNGKNEPFQQTVVYKK